MNFSEQYLTYAEYKALGGTLELTPFNLLEFKARKKIDERTQGRLLKLEKQPQEVKVCVYEMIILLNSYEGCKTQEKSIASESTDGYSVSYVGPNSTAVKSKNSETEDILRSCLGDLKVDGVPVLYLGVDL